MYTFYGTDFDLHNLVIAPIVQFKIPNRENKQRGTLSAMTAVTANEAEG
jgi:hypothetical protein